MHRRFLGIIVAAALIGVVGFAGPGRAADDYTVDTAHSGVTFKISHLGLAWIYGRFNDYSGSFSIDPDDASKCSFELNIKPSSIDTNNKKRDDHLRSGDFFNVKQFPTLTFKSTAVKAIKNGYRVTGDLKLHGEAKSVSFDLVGGRKAQFPKGVDRTGYSTEVTIKRSEFGMKTGGGMIGDEVHLSISFEGTKKK